jgi:hypothetical protein
VGLRLNTRILAQPPPAAIYFKDADFNASPLGNAMPWPPPIHNVTTRSRCRRVSSNEAAGWSERRQSRRSDRRGRCAPPSTSRYPRVGPALASPRLRSKAFSISIRSKSPSSSRRGRVPSAQPVSDRVRTCRLHSPDTVRHQPRHRLKLILFRPTALGNGVSYHHRAHIRALKTGTCQQGRTTVALSFVASTALRLPS